MNIIGYLNSKKGSTLVMVMLIMSILSIIGIALLSLSVMNIKMKKLDESSKTSFYWSESGLDEVYALTSKLVEEAINAGNNEVVAKLAELLSIQREKLYSGAEDVEYIDEAGNFTEAAMDELKGDIDSWFKAHYKAYLGAQNGYFHLTLEDDDSYMSIDKTKTTIAINSFQALNDRYSFIAVSTHNNNGITKTVRAKLEVKVPDYNTPFAVKTLKKEVYENSLLTKALVAEKDIVITGGEVTINGDVFVLGTKPTSASAKNNPKNYGGFIVGQGVNSGNVIINGNIASDSYIQTHANDSNITINGNTYCDSLVIQEDTVNCNIKINKESGIEGEISGLCTKDDVELNGNKGKIIIDAKYYGFSEGSAGHLVNSCLVVNSDDLGQPYGSWLVIKKEAYIAGTVYIYSNPMYQTGESIALKRSDNYLAYEHPFTNLPPNSLNELPEAEITVGTIDGHTTVLTNPRKYMSDNVVFSPYDPLYPVTGFKNGVSFDSTNKREYIYLYDRAYSNTLKKGGTSDSVIEVEDSGIILEKVMFAAGTFINKGQLTYTDNIEGNEAIVKASNKYTLEVYKMGDEEATEAGQVKLEDRFDFTGANASLYENTASNRELIYVNGSSSDIEIVGPGGIASKANSYQFGGSTIRGIIITKGDVYIKGNIKFAGGIFTTGNIYFEDSNAKSFTGNSDYIYSKLVELDLLKHFKNNKSTPVSKSIQSDISIGGSVKSYRDYSNIVKVLYWKRD